MPEWLQLPTQSGPEYLLIPVSASEDGVAVDPTTLDVEVQIQPLGEPDPEAWDTITDWDVAAGISRAQYLVGPLEPGLYKVWLKIEDTPETIVRAVGIVEAVA